MALSRRRWVGAAIAVALVVALLLLWDRGEEATEPSPPPVPTPSQALPPPPAAPAEPAPADPPTEATPFTPRGPEEEALAALADATGDGLVRCDLGPDAPEEPMAPFRRYHLDGTVLTALVSDPAGLALVHPAPPPGELLLEDAEAWTAALEASQRAALVLEWGDAWPGELGWCAVEAPRTVTLSGRAVPHPDAEREPLVVTGCGGEAATIADDLTFTKVVDRGPPCMLEVNSENMGSGQMVERTTDVAGLVLHQTVGGGPGDMADLLDARREELEELRTMADPLATAAEVPGLSDEARALLAGWADDDAAEAAERLKLLESSAAFFEAAAAQQ